MDKAAETYQEAVLVLSAIGADRGAAQLWFDLADLLERSAGRGVPRRLQARGRLDRAARAHSAPPARWSSAGGPVAGAPGPQGTRQRGSAAPDGARLLGARPSPGRRRPEGDGATAAVTTSFLAVAFMSVSWVFGAIGRCRRGSRMPHRDESCQTRDASRGIGVKLSQGALAPGSPRQPPSTTSRDFPRASETPRTS